MEGENGQLYLYNCLKFMHRYTNKLNKINKKQMSSLIKEQQHRTCFHKLCHLTI